MRFLRYKAHPKKSTAAFQSYGGAHLACWVNVKDPKEARQRAEALIAESDWEIDALEDEHALTREGYEESSDGLQYYDQALIDGEVLVAYTFPKEQ
jgi:hypothetical protein